MTEGPPTRVDAATAGLSLVGAMIAGAAAGYGLGSLVGLAVPLGLIGLFAGLSAVLLLSTLALKRSEAGRARGRASRCATPT